jgi:ubiquinone/menaquinone biosynthesis C-methylase UbiE
MKDDGRIYAVDISRELIHDLAERVDPRGEKNVVPILADMSKVPLPNASMTLIIFVNVYHEFEDRASGLAELCRLMKKDGRLLFVEWRTDQDQKGPPMEERVSREEARDDLKRAGLKILKELQPGPYQYGFLLEKRFN